MHLAAGWPVSAFSTTMSRRSSVQDSAKAHTMANRQAATASASGTEALPTAPPAGASQPPLITGTPERVDALMERLMSLQAERIGRTVALHELEQKLRQRQSRELAVHAAMSRAGVTASVQHASVLEHEVEQLVCQYVQADTGMCAAMRNIARPLTWTLARAPQLRRRARSHRTLLPSSQAPTACWCTAHQEQLLGTW